jgi:hypothetical protein
MPSDWIFNKSDHINLKAIHRRFGKVPIKTYPLYDTWLKKYSTNVLHAEWVSFLNLIPYNKADVKETISRELGWRDYGGKHYESNFTKFYQAYILPVKFKVDKRKPHLSNLICSGQISKADALEELKKSLYEPEELNRDYEYVLKKFDLTRGEFEQIMLLPVRRHNSFPVETSFYARYPVLKPFKPLVKWLNK